MAARRRRFGIFISYAPPNAGMAHSIFQRLREARFHPWIDPESNVEGAEWEYAIERALKESHVVLVLLSKESVTCDGFLQKQIHTALDIWKHKAPGEVHLLAVRVEECDIHERLLGAQYIDLFHESGWARLISLLKGLRKSSAAESRRTVASSSHVSPKANVEKLRPRGRRQLPLVAFPDEMESFLAGSDYRDQWSRLDRNVQHYVRTLGCKLEPIVQIIPARGAPVVLGFECLALGPSGENFGEIITECDRVDVGILRICLAIAALQTISQLRTGALHRNAAGARKLLFSLNLDTVMLDSPHFKRFLRCYGEILDRNVIFEVNETTTAKYLTQLKNLQSDFNLRYAADDLNNWKDEVRSALISRVELTKMDHLSFKAAMDIRGDDPQGAINRLRANKVGSKPLVVEGVQDSDYLEFLERNWVYGELYGQGYQLDPGLYWNLEMLSLKDFGLPGGSALRRRG